MIGLLFLLGTRDVTQEARALLSHEPTGLSVRSIEACAIRMNALSNSADFVGQWIFRATVGTDGSVAAIRMRDDPADAARFIEFGDFKECVSHWRFVQRGEYTILLHGGAMTPQWTVVIANGNQSMRIQMPKR